MHFLLQKVRLGVSSVAVKLFLLLLFIEHNIVVVGRELHLGAVKALNCQAGRNLVLHRPAIFFLLHQVQLSPAGLLYLWLANLRERLSLFVTIAFASVVVSAQNKVLWRMLRDLSYLGLVILVQFRTLA